MSDQKLRWGILSTAKIGLRAVVPAIQQSRNGVVTAIASREIARAQNTAQALNIPRAFGSYEALLEASEIDAVYIPLPNSMHKAWTIRAAQNGKHVLCEKPFALNVSEVDEMIAAAKQYRVVLMEAFMHRFHPQFTRVKELIAEGMIGQVRTIRSAFCYFLNRPNDIRRDPALGGGAMMDVGCYCVNMSRLIADAEPVEVQASAVIGASGVDETLAGILRFPGEVIATFDCSFQTDYTEWLQVQGTEGRLDVVRPIKPMLNPAEIILRRGEKADAPATVTKITAPAANHYQRMVEHFDDVVLTGARLQFPPELDRGNMRVIDALFESTRTGRAVRIA